MWVLAIEVIYKYSKIIHSIDKAARDENNTQDMMSYLN